MSVRESRALRDRTDGTQKQVKGLRTPADQALQEASQQVEPRVTQVRADISARQQSAGEGADGATEKAHSQWERMTADAARRMSRLPDRIDRKQDEFGDIAPELEAAASRGRCARCLALRLADNRANPGRCA